MTSKKSYVHTPVPERYVMYDSKGTRTILEGPSALNYIKIYQRQRSGLKYNKINDEDFKTMVKKSAFLSANDISRKLLEFAKTGRLDD